MLNIEKYKDEIMQKFFNKLTYYGHGKLDSEMICSTVGGIYAKCTGDESYTFETIMDWLCEEYKEPILDEVEREYLSNVITPFKDKVRLIYKKTNDYKSNQELLCIYCVSDGDGWNVNLPPFKKGTMYIGIEVDKEYTLEELGLC